jgi:hypothetical protein
VSLDTRSVRRKIASVTINGKPWTDIDAARERIRLAKLKGPIELVVKTK